uniref:FRA10A associated CGG repeat 1 n=1 Tax=Esox lucius TaxID=8010 RepID=A0A6Q2XFI7_ESOLU
VHGGGGYDSDFSDDEGQGETSQLKRKRDDEILRKPFQKGRHTKLAHRDVAAHEYDREEARNRRHHLISMNAYERHKKFVSDYILYYGGKVEDLRRSTANDKSDLDVVRENHRFLWRDEDEEQMTWEKELAKKYYDKLFKEYCIADLSRYKENKFGFRWRIEKEVVSGKGQFVCGNKRCEVEEGLKSWEVNFAYVEQGEKRNALVKLSKILLSFYLDFYQLCTSRQTFLSTLICKTAQAPSSCLGDLWSTAILYLFVSFCSFGFTFGVIVLLDQFLCTLLHPFCPQSSRGPDAEKDPNSMMLPSPGFTIEDCVWCLICAKGSASQ